MIFLPLPMVLGPVILKKLKVVASILKIRKTTTDKVELMTMNRGHGMLGK